MQHPRVRVVLDETGLVEGCQAGGTFQMVGNIDRGVDQIATALVGADSKKIVQLPGDWHEHHNRPIRATTAHVAYSNWT